MKLLRDIEGAANPAPIAQDNFEEIDLRLFSHKISAPGGTITTLIGPPEAGDLLGADTAWAVGDLWRDALRGLWRCTVAGDPGTWVQIQPAIVAADPVAGTIPTGYLIARSDLGLIQKRHEGGYTWAELVPRRLSASASLDFAEIAAGDFEDLTITVTGAEAGDPVTLALPVAPEALIVYQAYVSDADIVTVRAQNFTAAPIDPDSGTFNVIVLKY